MHSASEIRWLAQPEVERSDLGLHNLGGVKTIELYHATPQTGTYSHHCHIAHHEKTLFATWSNHMRDEDAPGQFVRLSRSTDGGKTWTEPVEVIPPLDHPSPASEDGHGRRTVCANGLEVVDGTLYALAEVWQHGGGARGGDSGLGRIARSVAADGSLGPIFWLRDDPPRPLRGLHAYPGSDSPEFTDLVRRINARLARPEYLPTWELRSGTTRPTAPDGHLLCEPTHAYRLRDGTLVRFLRDLKGSRCNYVSLSPDDGATWTGPARTEFPDAPSRSCVGVLPDGSAYVINDPRQGNSGSHPSRDPLAISIARDGLRFDRIATIVHGAPQERHEGRWKGRGFQYPASIVVGHHLWVVCSVNKEDVRVSRVPLDALAAMPVARADPGT